MSIVSQMPPRAQKHLFCLAVLLCCGFIGFDGVIIESWVLIVRWQGQGNLSIDAMHTAIWSTYHFGIFSKGTKHIYGVTQSADYRVSVIHLNKYEGLIMLPKDIHILWSLLMNKDLIEVVQMAILQRTTILTQTSVNEIWGLCSVQKGCHVFCKI